MRLRLSIAAVTVLFVLWSAFAPNDGGAQSLSSKIDAKERAIERDRAKEGVLTSDIQGFSQRIEALEVDISSLQARQETIQADLDAKLARLEVIQDDLRTERARLVRLRARLAEGRAQLAKRLVELYKADSPDILSVVMSSEGFADLLESSEFARRIGRQDNRIIAFVRDARAESARIAARLTGLEDEQQQIAEVVEDRRDEVAGVKETLVVRRDSVASERADKSAALGSIRGHRHRLEGDLNGLREQQARIQARLAGAPAGGIVGQVRQGAGGIVWPVNGPIVSPFGQRWGRLHAGVDIAVPSGTAVVAPGPGTVAIAGWVGGYGNYVCVQHAGSLSTCSAHNTTLAVSVGQSVSQGQVIASSGCTGSCFGPHVHFETRLNGSPVDPMGYL